MRKLRLDAEAAVLLVERREHDLDDRVERRAPRPPARSAAVARARLRALDFAAARAQRVAHAIAGCQPSGPARRTCRRRADRLRRQERGRRPAAQVVALVDVGTAIGVDANRDEAVVNDDTTAGSAYVVRSISWQARHHAAVIDSSTGLLFPRGARERVARSTAATRSIVGHASRHAGEEP